MRLPKESVSTSSLAAQTKRITDNEMTWCRHADYDVTVCETNGLTVQYPPAFECILYVR